MATIELSKEEIDFIVESTGISERKIAIEYFAKLMSLENIQIKHMPVLVRKMMKRKKK